MAGTVKKTLANATATSLFSISLNTLAMSGGVVFYMVSATNGTDMQAATGVVAYSSVNKGGVYTTSISVTPTPTASVASFGTLAVVWSVLNGTNIATIQVTATSSFSRPSTGYPSITYMLISDFPSTVTTL